MATLSLAHKTMVKDLTRLIIPIERFIEVCKKELTPKAEALHLGWKKHQKLLADVLGLEQSASLKWSQLQEQQNLHGDVIEDKEETPPNMIEIGSKSLPSDKFNALLAHMQNKIPSEDIWKLLGTYKDCYNGEMMLNFLKKQVQMSETEAREFLDYLCMYGYIKPISYTGVLNTFSTAGDYQWKIFAAEYANDSGVKKLKLQATRATVEAGRAARHLEHLRLSLDVQTLEYTNQVQSLMTEHIKIVKETLKSLLEIDKMPLDAIKTIGDRLSVFLESLNPSKDVAAIAENDKTGFKPVPTFLPKSFPIDPNHILFGLSLESYEQATKNRVPQIITKAIEYLTDTFIISDSKASSHVDVWISPITNLPAIHSLRTILNSTPKVTRGILRKFPPETIVGTLKLYLLELPDSICSQDLYESLKMLYLSKTDDSASNRISSVRNLLASMPSSHFYSLARLVSYWSGLVESIDVNDRRIGDFCAVLGPYVLRPKVESKLTINDKHPARLVRDLILHPTESIHPEALTPAGNSASSLVIDEVEDEDADKASLDDMASIRVLWDSAEHRNNPIRPGSVTSIASSFKSHFTKKTGYSLTIQEESAESKPVRSSEGPSSPILDMEHLTASLDSISKETEGDNSEAEKKQD